MISSYKYWIFVHTQSITKALLQIRKYNLTWLDDGKPTMLGQQWQTDRMPTLTMLMITIVGPMVANRQEANHDNVQRNKW